MIPVPPPYLFKDAKVAYSVTDANEATTQREYTCHNFAGTGQRYERVVNLMEEGVSCHHGMVGRAQFIVMEARPMWAATEAALRADPLCLTEEIEAGAEDHLLTTGRDGTTRYAVGRAPR